MAEQTFTFAAADELSVNSFTRTGYTFQGWAVSCDADSADYADGQNFNVPSHNITLYAVWKANEYAVTFNSNNSGAQTATQKVTFGKTQTLNANKFSFHGYRFAGWNTAADGSWTFTLTAEQGGTSFSGTTEKNISVGENTLFFELKISSFGNEAGSLSVRLSFADAPNSDKVTKAVASLENLDGTSVPGVSTQTLIPSENAVTFTAGNIVASTYRAKIIFYSTQSGADIELAVWRDLIQISSSLASTANCSIESFENLYTITYSLNGGTLAQGTSLQETVTGKSDAIILPQLTRNYYTFDGWYTTENFADGTEVTALENFTENIAVYAKFTPLTYTITYVLNGGKLPDEIVTNYHVYDAVILPLPLSDDQIFGGWYTTENFSSDRITGWNANEKHENLSVYAKWDGYVVTVDNIIDKINTMTESGTIKASGDFSSLSFNDLKSAICKHTGTNIYINLDLSETEGIIEIPEQAFDSCESLIGIKIPDSVTAIGSDTFRNCCNLKELTIPFVGKTPEPVSKLDSLFGIIFGYTCLNKEKLSTVTSSYAKSVYTTENYKWSKPNSLKSVTITGGKISEIAFENCDTISTIILLDSVTQIVKYAFENYTDLKSIIIPDSVQRIGSGAFSGYSSLKEITIPFVGNTESETDGQFGDIFGSKQKSDCYVATTIQPYKTHYIPNKLKKVTVKAGNIDRSAFQNCSSLTEIVLPETITSISENTFLGCSSLSKITIPETVISIGDQAFRECTALTTISIPKNKEVDHHL